MRAQNSCITSVTLLCKRDMDIPSSSELLVSYKVFMSICNLGDLCPGLTVPSSHMNPTCHLDRNINTHSLANIRCFPASSIISSYRSQSESVIYSLTYFCLLRSLPPRKSRLTGSSGSPSSPRPIWPLPLLTLPTPCCSLHSVYSMLRLCPYWYAPLLSPLSL